MRQGRGGATATAAVVGVVGLVLLLVGWAATSGPTRVLHGGRAAQTREPRVTPTSSPAAGGPPGGGERFVPQDHPWLTVLFVLVEGAAVLLLAVLLYRLLRVLVTRVPAFRRRGPRPAEPEFEVLDEPAELARAITRGAATQRGELLGAGTPRNAIVACWHRFEEQAAGVGVVRHPWETSSEFTLRILDELDADTAAVSRLAALYREARFSEHELGEQARADAVAALDSVHQGLLTRAAGS